MPSSTSNSEEVAHTSPPRLRRLTRGTWWLLAGVAVLLAAAELIASYGFDRISKVQRLMNEEYREAVHLSPRAADGSATVLVLGNSLLRDGVDLPRLQAELRPGLEAHRYLVLATVAQDWVYCLRHLFREGGRPRHVVLLLPTNHLMSNGSRGDYAARFYVDWQDLPALAADTHLDLTSTSSLFLSHVSTYYAGRVNLRQLLLNRLSPAYFPMSQRFFTIPGPPLDLSAIMPTVTPRLARLRAICAEHGAELSLVLPPVHGQHEETVCAAAKQVGVRCLVPIPGDSMPWSGYYDGFHLNAQGRALFTPKLGRLLQSALVPMPGS